MMNGVLMVLAPQYGWTVVKLLCNTMFHIFPPFIYTLTNQLPLQGMGTMSFYALCTKSILLVFLLVMILGNEIEQAIFSSCRNRKEDSDVVEFENDSWSDDSGSDNLSTSLSNNSSKAWDAVSEDSSLDQEGSWPMKDRLGCPYLQYIEMASPYWRVPLMDKALLFTCFTHIFSILLISISILVSCFHLTVKSDLVYLCFCDWPFLSDNSISSELSSIDDTQECGSFPSELDCRCLVSLISCPFNVSTRIIRTFCGWW